MKRRLLALLCVLELLVLIVISTGAYIKFNILRPLGLDDKYSLFALPFVYFSEDVQLEVYAAKNPPVVPDPTDPTDPPTEPTTQPTEPTTPEEEIPKTGDVWVNGWMAILALSCGGALMLLSGKKKRA